MKLLHLSDLHIGKRLCEMSLLEDQRYILRQILGQIERLRPEAVLIAGDVYDKPLPPAEAVDLFDRFLTGIADCGSEVFLVSGNHDSPERLGFGGRLMQARGVHIAGPFSGAPLRVEREYDCGAVVFDLLPFVKPATVRAALPDAKIESYTDAVRAALTAAPRDDTRTHVLIAHQFVTGATPPEECDSESVAVGGVDHIPAELFAGYDYVALGHLHSPQSVGSERVRYAGSPLKYSFSEEQKDKSIPLVEIAEKGKVELQFLPLVPLHGMRTIRGPIDALTSPEVVGAADAEDYIRVVLTDECPPAGAAERLRCFYPNLMQITFDNSRTRAREAAATRAAAPAARSRLALFEEFYESQNGAPLPEKGAALVRAMFAEGGEKE